MRHSRDDAFMLHLSVASTGRHREGGTLIAHSLKYIAVGASYLLNPLLGLHSGTTAYGFCMWPGPPITETVFKD